MLLVGQNIFSQFDTCQQKQMFIGIIFLLLLGILILLLCQQSKQKQVSRKKLILIGLSGVGKTKLFNIASENQVQRKNNHTDIDDFYEFPIGDHYDIVDSPSAVFEESISKREATIKKFQSYFKLNFYYIEKFYLVVNFERTDIMKNKCLNVHKYFKNFSSIIDLVITNFQLSDDEINDKEHLVKAFSIYVKDPNKIHFIRDDIQSEELRLIFIQSANLGDLEDQFKKKNTKILNGNQYEFIEECKMDQEENALQLQ